MIDLRDQLQALLGDKYTLDRELGGGGMSRVFLATDVALRRLVVVKVLPPELAADVSTERFRREIQLAARLQHPHIVPLLAANEGVGLLYYTAPFVAGESLRDRLTRDAVMKIDEAVRLAREIALALDYACRQGVVHRDVKPENVLLSDGQALLTDFGIAKAVHASGGSLTSTGLSLGTPTYMAPEQASGGQDVDGRADLYALGCMLYEMLAGQPPYSGPTVQSIIAQHVAAPIPSVRALRPSVSPALDATIARAMAKQPVDRFASAADFERALGGVTSRQRGRDRLTRVRWPMAAAAVTLALLIAAAVWVRTRSSRGLDSRRVLVAPLENKTGDRSLDALGAMAADWVRRGVTESALADAAETTNQPAAAGGLEAARGAHAGTLISGTIYRRGDTLEFNARISDVNEGRIIREVSPVFAIIGQPMPGVSALRQRVLAELATILNPRFSEVARVATHPPTFEAYREVVEGDELAGRSDAENALAHYRRAFAMDSSFGGAIVRIGTMLAILGRCDEADSLISTVARRGVSLTSYEQLQQRRQVAFCHNDLPGTYASALEMTRLAPLSEDAWMRLAYSAKYLDRYTEAARILDSLARRPAGLRDERAYGDLALCYHMLGQYKREQEIAESRLRKGGSRVRDLSLAEVRALAALGQFARLDSAVKDLVADRWNDEHLSWLITAGDELSAHGYAVQGRTFWDRVLTTLAIAPDSARENAIGSMLLANYRLGRYPEADSLNRRFDQLWPPATPSDSIGSIGFSGLLAAHQGRRQDAEAASARIALFHRTSFKGEPAFLRAAITSVLGDREAAVRLLRQAFAVHPNPRERVHSDAAFRSLKGYAPFESLIRPPG